MIKDAFLQLCTAQAFTAASPVLTTGTISAVNARSFGNADLFAHVAVTTSFTVLASITQLRVDIVVDDTTPNSQILGSMIFATGATAATEKTLLVAGAHFFIPLAPIGQGLNPGLPTAVGGGVRTDIAVYSFIRGVVTYTGTVTTGALSIDIGLKPTILGRNYPAGTGTYAL
jgi:hypothetical protein